VSIKDKVASVMPHKFEEKEDENPVKSRGLEKKKIV